MRACGDHWQKLRAAIESRGLARYIAKGGADAAARLAKQSGGEVDGTNVTISAEATAEHLMREKVDGTDVRQWARETFEPLMAAYFAILGNALNVAGMDIMAPNEDGTDRCPLCFLIAACKCGK